jgi:hypothetical protein
VFPHLQYRDHCDVCLIPKRNNEDHAPGARFGSEERRKLEVREGQKQERNRKKGRKKERKKEREGEKNRRKFVHLSIQYIFTQYIPHTNEIPKKKTKKKQSLWASKPTKAILCDEDYDRSHSQVARNAEKI